MTNEERKSFPDKLVFPAADSNKEAILEILRNHIVPISKPVSVLEIGSGAGQHIVYFAAHFPLAKFQPSDINLTYLKSIQAYIDEYDTTASIKNISSPLSIDVLSSDTYPNQSFDFIYCCNLIHITPIACTHGLFKLAERLLKTEGSLITYGPYGLPNGGRITPESNRLFHDNLRRQNPEWGLKGIDELEIIANDHQIKLRNIFDMPCNNKILWWIKTNDT